MTNVIGTNPYMGIYYPDKPKIVPKPKPKPKPKYHDYSDKLNFSQFNNKKNIIIKWNHKPDGF
jgi:hypothetical protein